MTAEQLREKFLKFFQERGHRVIPAASLVPENDPTVLFTTAGMHPLVPYLLGQPHPLGKRLCNVQKCVRTSDIDEVGDNTHLTFFEMLGNWSLGDYFKKEAIQWSFEFLTKELKLPVEKLAVSVFAGERDIPPDNEAAALWQSLGILPGRLAYLGREANWWGPAGQTGPCGPSTEMFYWVGKGEAPKVFVPEDKNWVEIWNDVFMGYQKKLKDKTTAAKREKEGKREKGVEEEYEYVALVQKNVDTGMGLERTLAVLNKKENIFQTELFSPLIEKIRELGCRREERAERIIADHLKASVFILAEGIVPSNIERGYVLRRLIRRMKIYAGQLGIKGIISHKVAAVVIEIYKNIYPEVYRHQDFIFEQLIKEEEVFEGVLERGTSKAGKLIKELLKRGRQKVSGKEAFDLYQSFGLPWQKIKEIAEDNGLIVDEEGFYQELKNHRELSRQGSGVFKAGLADNSAQVIKYHTATHLLHAALRKVLGEGVRQMGSNITAERLRFDFSFERKLTQEEIKRVEEIVNEKIKENLKVQKEEMSLEQALRYGALGFFKERYPERVFVYTISNPETGEVFSKEICSGPHMERTAGLGKFKIIKEESSAAGVRRLKAVLE